MLSVGLTGGLATGKSHVGRHLADLGCFLVKADELGVDLDKVTPEAKIIDDLGGAVERISVTDLSDDVFFARIILRQNGREIEVDSRPSDAIALAVRAHVPIMVDEAVMEKAGVVLSGDDDGDIEPLNDSTPPELERAGDVDEERLSVFRDFINTLDLDDFDRKSGN